MLIKIRDYYIDDNDISRMTPVYSGNENTCVFFHIYFKHTGNYEQIRYEVSKYKDLGIDGLMKKVNIIRDNIAKSLQPHIKITDFDLETINDGE